MGNESTGIISTKSKINYDYKTIKITQSRIDKGLIAIPVSLAPCFPPQNEEIQVYLNDSPISETKRYSSYTSSNRECRIFGVTEWFQKNRIKSGDEIVIQFIDRDRHIYRLIPERNFITKTQELQNVFDSSETEKEATEKIETLATWTHAENDTVLFNELYRLSEKQIPEKRFYVRRNSGRVREGIPSHIRTLLIGIYKGHCQVCDFSFLKKDKTPYFEIHHLDPQKGHNPQNLVAVCGNCHNQFEHAIVKPEYDNSWLVKVTFNELSHPVNQALLNRKFEFSKTIYA